MVLTSTYTFLVSKTLISNQTRTFDFVFYWVSLGKVTLVFWLLRSFKESRLKFSIFRFENLISGPKSYRDFRETGPRHLDFVPREWLAAKGQLVKWNLSYLECWCYKGLQVQVRGVQGLIHRSFSLHHVPSQLMGKKKKPHRQVIRRLTKKKYSPLRRSWWSFYKRDMIKYHQNVLLNV